MKSSRKTEAASATPTVRVISSGGVIYRKIKSDIDVALIRVRERWGLPKGQVEGGESLQDTALRARRPPERARHGDIVGNREAYFFVVLHLAESKIALARLTVGACAIYN